MRRYRVMLVPVAAAVCLVGCSSGSDGESSAESTAASASTVPDTTAEQTTTSTTSTTTSTTSTTEPDPVADSVAEFADALATPDRAGLDLLVPGSAAYVYYEAIVLLAETQPGEAEVTVEGDTIKLYARIDLSDFVVDDSGLISDFTRDGTPISESVVASGAVFEGRDEGAGIVGIVHSIRYLDGNLQVVVTTINDSQVEGELQFGDYVSDGRQYTNVYSNSVYPGVTSTVLNVFEDVPASGGVLYGHIWAEGIGVTEPTLEVPPLGG